ncbi:MAG: hypothetical protein NT015_01070 [Alphaproteobacteria bacterium]|nr:hypothetical protein [Alphaproteobacteria bacterium]
MRRILIALVLAACTPASPPSQPAVMPSAAVCENPDGLSATDAARCAGNDGADAPSWADVANDPQLIGHWTANTDETLASFGGDASPPAFAFGCERGFLQIERNFSRPPELAFGAGTPFNIVIARETIPYVATVSTNGRLWLAAPSLDPRLDDFVASEDGFAIQTAGDTTRFRHDPMLARVLANCRAD